MVSVFTTRAYRAPLLLVCLIIQFTKRKESLPLGTRKKIHPPPVRQALLGVDAQPWVEQLVPLVERRGEPVEAAVMEVQYLVLALAAGDDELARGALGIGEEQPEGAHAAEVDGETTTAMGTAHRDGGGRRAVREGQVVLERQELGAAQPRRDLLCNGF